MSNAGTGRMRTVTGAFVYNAKGFGFVRNPAAGGQDVRIENPGTAMTGDLVEARITHVSFTRTGAQRLEGVIVRIVSRARNQWLGTLHIIGQSAHVTSVQPVLFDRIPVDLPVPADAGRGMTVLVRWSDAQRTRCKVCKLLGEDFGNIPALERVIYMYELKAEFDASTLEESRGLPDRVDEKEIASRTDLREAWTVTIDGEDSKDFDDAVSVRIRDNGNWELGVHIADVSYYVKPDTALDREAFERGNSVYLIDHVLPMLPEKLSNDICSLNPDQVRLTVSCIMEIDRQGQIVSADISRTVIRSHARLTYTQVNAFYAGDREAVQEPALRTVLDEMLRVSSALTAARKKRGLLDLDIPEADFVLDDNGRCTDVRRKERGVSHLMIENFMLAANETVACYLVDHEICSVFRIHEQPDTDKLQSLADYCARIGVSNSGIKKGVKPKYLATLIEEAGTAGKAEPLSQVMLRTMQKARYSAENTGHYGLGAEYYCHFTSPIRRYSDLIVHRTLFGSADYSGDQMDDIADQCSNCEIDSMDAERAYDSIKMAEYMERHLFEAFDGVVTGITEHSLFVTLDNTITGMVPDQYLNDYMTFDSHAGTMRGVSRVIEIGSPITIKAVTSDLITGKITMIEATERVETKWRNGIGLRRRR